MPPRKSLGVALFAATPRSFVAAGYSLQSLTQPSRMMFASISKMRSTLPQQTPVSMRLLYSLAFTSLSIAASAQVPAYVPTNGLQSWYPFNGNANDESGNGNNGTVNGAVLTTNRVGAANAAYSFNGTNSFISLTGNAGIVDDVSLSFWMKPTNTSDGYLLDRDICATSNDWAIYWADNGEIGLRYGMNGNDYFIQGVNASVGAWHHAVAVRDVTASELRLYLDGQLAGSISFPAGSFSNTALPVFVGESNCNSGSNPNFLGDIDDIGIWDRVLTPQEVLNLFNGLGPCLSPTATSLSGLNTSYLTSDPPAALVGTPSGGIFIGPGVSESTFTPSVAGPGTHTIIYTYVDDNGCVNSTGLCTNVSLGIGINDGDHTPLQGVRVFPNPADGLFHLELELQGMVSLLVVDSRGRQVMNRTFMANGSKTLQVVDLSQEASGTYSLRVSTDQGSSQQSLVRQ